MSDAAEMARRLSEPQKALLEEVRRRGGGSCDPDYKPAQKLLALGLVDAREMKYGSSWLVITPLGAAVRSVLAKESPDAA